ncbi:alpha/beta hydrolase [Staphylococcus borealis]|uniref:alpha/beta hydrolase n=1 Tax=Staphylococcus borealis TaxID=2742203 RepID=UPI0039E8156D
MKKSHILYFQNHKIFIQLPRHYSKDNSRFYQTIIAQDGNHLFKSIKRHNIIFIGIEPYHRAHEYTPWSSAQNPEGGGAATYLKWLSTELLPFLRAQYRISPDNRDLAIAGASYGGLLSLYALLTTPHQFGNYIILSPSMWYPDILDFLGKCDPIHEAKHIYWYVGGREGIKHTKIIKPMVRNNQLAVQIVESLLLSSNSKLKFDINNQGIHRQRFFKKHFKQGLRYLKFNKKGS